jgi:hypothetical protein
VTQSYVTGTSIPVLRGLDGSATAAHAAAANATVGLASDFDSAPPGAAGSAVVPTQRARVLRSYSAAGAIALPQSGEDVVAVLNGTTAIAMTVAAPPKDIDGSILYVLGNGKSASTVTFASGLGNAGAAYDVITFQAAGQVGLSVMACNGFWVLVGGPVTGTSTAVSVAIG